MESKLENCKRVPKTKSTEKKYRIAHEKDDKKMEEEMAETWLPKFKQSPNDKRDHMSMNKIINETTTRSIETRIQRPANQAMVCPDTGERQTDIPKKKKNGQIHADKYISISLFFLKKNTNVVDRSQHK